MSDITDVLPRMEDVRLEKRLQIAAAIVADNNPSAAIDNYLQYKNTVELLQNAERKLTARQRKPEPVYAPARFEAAYFTV